MSSTPVLFMRLINNIGSICSCLEQPVYYDTEYFRTVQDYVRHESETLTVKVLKKKKNQKESIRRVNFRHPTDERDVRKTQISTCVNFIHQKDAYIAMRLIEKLCLKYLLDC